jgi:hypothetical protein
MLLSRCPKMEHGQPSPIRLIFSRGSVKSDSSPSGSFEAKELVVDGGMAWSGRGGPDGVGLASVYMLRIVQRSQFHASSAQIHDQYCSAQSQDQSCPQGGGRRSRGGGLSVADLIDREIARRLRPRSWAKAKIGGVIRADAMTKALPFTAAGIARVIEGVRKAGLPITATSVDLEHGTITVHHQGVPAPTVPTVNENEDDTHHNWADA